MFVFEIYINIPRPPRCRAARTRPPDSQAARTYLQNKSIKYYTEIPGGPARCRGSGAARCLPPGSGAVAPQAARLRGDRLPLHYIRVWLPPHPSFASLKIQKKKREGRERRGEGERRSGEALLDFQAGDCR